MADPVTAEPLRYAIDGPVARLTLDSPHNRNALSTAMVRGLGERLAEAAAEPGVRCVVLGHAGSVFCAGADLGEATTGPTGAGPVAEGAATDAVTRRAADLAALLRALLELPVPVIGAVNGHVRAGGLGLLGACDIVVAGPRSTFALTEARLGLAPSIISLTLLPRMSPRAAGRYFVTGERFGATEAVTAGLATVAADDVDAAVRALTDEIVTGSPQGLAASKALTTAPLLAGFDRDAAGLVAESAALFGTAQAREGMLAFLQKRAPDWSAAR